MIKLVLISFVWMIALVIDILFGLITFAYLRIKKHSVKQDLCPVPECKNIKKDTQYRALVLTKPKKNKSRAVSNAGEYYPPLGNTVSACSWELENNGYEDAEDEYRSEVYDETEDEEDDFWMEDDNNNGFVFFNSDSDDDYYDDWDETEDNTESDDRTYFFNGLGEPATEWDDDDDFCGGPFSGI